MGIVFKAQHVFLKTPYAIKVILPDFVGNDPMLATRFRQEAMVAAIRALDRFDRRRPLRPWLHRIVANRAIDWARLRALRSEVFAHEAPDGSSETSADGRRWSDPVMTALAELAPDQRAVVVLRHLLGYTPGEIAAMLELPRGTVNSRLRRGLDALESRLREMEAR